jgi:phosphoserine phosphatase
MRDLCVFDLDGTLIPYDSFGRIVRGSLAAHPQLIAAGLARKAGVISRDGFARMAHRRLVCSLDGDALKRIADGVAADTIPARRRLIGDWRGKGAFVVLMSASPHEYVKLAGMALGFDAAHGSEFRGADYLHLYGRKKLEFLDQHYPPEAWRRVFAIADSPSDSALLAAFEEQIMV